MFEINGIWWKIRFVDSWDASLKRSDGSYSLAVTDANTSTVYISKWLKGAKLRRVVAHELCHCFCFSFDVHMPLEQEEYLADWISLYGADLVYLLDDLMTIITKNRGVA